MKQSVPAFLASLPVFGSSLKKKAISQRQQTKYLLYTKPVSPPDVVQRVSPKAVDSLVLTEENVNQALDEVRLKLGSIFGNSEENRQVGITGDVMLSSIDGPTVVLRLQGRFWHKRSDVLARVSAYLTDRIPEICDVEIEDVQQLEDSEAESNRLV
ncbi:unnamed protein product [Agarophyton chilense]